MKLHNINEQGIQIDWESLEIRTELDTFKKKYIQASTPEKKANIQMKISLLMDRYSHIKAWESIIYHNVVMQQFEV